MAGGFSMRQCLQTIEGPPLGAPGPRYHLQYSVFWSRTGDMLAVTTFGDRVRSARLEARMTQEQLSQSSGVSVRTIVGLESGRVLRPRRDTVIGWTGQRRSRCGGSAGGCPLRGNR